VNLSRLLQTDCRHYGLKGHGFRPRRFERKQFGFQPLRQNVATSLRAGCELKMRFSPRLTRLVASCDLFAEKHGAGQIRNQTGSRVEEWAFQARVISGTSRAFSPGETQHETVPVSTTP
jgi:hypothetical protein